ncbi:MAG: hypothetical protein AAF555_01165 [Verrucomicrobiota bacterium]
MKLLVCLLTLGALLPSAQAEGPLIQLAFQVETGNVEPTRQVLEAPKVIFLPGEEVEVMVAREFFQDPNLMLPVGVMVTTTADVTEQKISYPSCSLFESRWRARAK